MSESKVQKKLSKLIQFELSTLLQRDFVYTPGAMLTVNVVRVTPDLGFAKVYVSVFPDAKLHEAVEKLNAHGWEIRKGLAGRIRNKVRTIPELQFFMDDSFAEADRIGKLLNKLKEEDQMGNEGTENEEIA
ncbi:MAG: 30S ribosome-binding factor RbfA [Bacteroidota bacterium]